MSDLLITKTSAGKKIEPCPFCGDTSIYLQREGTNRASCIVFCGECGCKLESNEIGYGDFWNNRPKLPKTIENVVETIYSHYKKNGGYTRMAADFIQKITGRRWERDEEIDNLKEEIKKLKEK
jgi:hypothetical protein